jgi:hypothetical protein
MTRLLFILILHSIFICGAKAQTITVDDLLTLSNLPTKNVDHFMNKKGFVTGSGSFQYNASAVSFFQKRSKKKRAVPPSVIQSVDIYQKEGSYWFTLHTTSVGEWVDGKNRLKKEGFFYDKDVDTSGAVSLLFQKRTISILADSSRKDSSTQYNFSLQLMELPEPGSIQDAEDLLKFDSHEHLATVFGPSNVKKDLYYFTEKQMKKCSILFANTSRQAIFVWEDEGNLRKLAYVIVSSISPTLSAARFSGYVSPNRWITKKGISASMSLRELLQLNGEDFEFYGINSEFAYMVEPKRTGNLDFKKTGVMLGCLDCSDSKLLEKTKISAANAVDKNLYLYVFYIMIRP